MKTTVKYYAFAGFLFFALMNWHCLKSKRPGIPEEVRKTLDMAGLNKISLLSAIGHYVENGDSLKLRALYWLIANMKANYTVRYHVQDSLGHRFRFNPMDYCCYLSLKHHWDSIEQLRGNLIYKPDTFLIDYEEVSGDFLIKNINEAYDAWQQNPWSKGYSPAQFYQWILPYRCMNEEVENFRDYFQKKYGRQVGLLKTTNPFVCAKFLDSLINDDIDYQDSFNKEANIQLLDSLAQKHFGSYFDVAVYKVKALRSFGIAAALDYTPFLADTNFGFAWATAIYPDGSELKLFPKTRIRHLFKSGRMAKTYRRTFETLKNSLRAIKKTSVSTPPFLGHFDYFDITDKLQSADLALNFSGKIKYAYLAVFNDGEWHPIDWAKPDSNNQALFCRMGKPIVYLPLQMENGKLYRLGNPFLLNASGKKHILIPQFEHQTEASIEKVSPTGRLQFRKKYTLFVWNGNWQELYEFVGYRFPLSFQLPTNGLFLISDNNIDFDERIFIIDKTGQQVFY